METIISKVLDKENILWVNNQYINIMMVRSVEERLNLLLRFDGKVYLNEAFNSLGFPATKTGGMLGWVIDDDNMTNIKLSITASGDATDPYLIITFDGLTELC